MTLEEKVQKGIMDAMKAKDDTRLSALRSIKTAIQNEKTSGVYHELTDADVLKLIQKLAKQRAESEQIYLQSSESHKGTSEADMERRAKLISLAENEKNERLVLEEFLPKQLTEDEVTEIVKKAISEVGATSMKDMGKVMGFVTKAVAGQADGKTISTIVKSLLGA